MATDYGTKEKGGSQPEVGTGFGADKEMKSHGNSKGAKHTNDRDHDKMLNKMMPSAGDCE